MEKRMFYYSLPLTGHTFKSMVYNLDDLCYLFQRWAEKNYEIKPGEAVALWYLGSDKETTVFNDEELRKLAQGAFHVGQSKMPFLDNAVYLN